MIRLGFVFDEPAYATFELRVAVELLPLLYPEFPKIFVIASAKVFDVVIAEEL
jgi:hypothetical protein